MAPEDTAPDHGLAFVFDGDTVELVDNAAPDRPRIRFSLAEYEAFRQGTRAGDFDLERLRSRSTEDPH